MSTQVNLISEIRRLCREFGDKLPENKSELKVLPVYAENIIRRFDGNVTTKREIENQSMIWDGIFEIYEDTCKTLKIGDEIIVRGAALNIMVSSYLKYLIDHIHPTNNRDIQLLWINEWLSDLDVSKVDTKKLSDESVARLIRIQKTVNDIVNDLLASCQNHDLSTANIINVYRDDDILVDMLNLYNKYIGHLKYNRESEYSDFKDATEGTAFSESRLSDNCRKLIRGASGMMVNGYIIK